MLECPSAADQDPHTHSVNIITVRSNDLPDSKQVGNAIV